MRAFSPIPPDFREEVDLAVAERLPGKLGVLAAEAEGFAWESEGLRVVGRAQLKLKAYRGAAATWEAIRKVNPDDVEANTSLGAIYERLGQPELPPVLPRVLLFTGHMIDAPGRPRPRFPADQEGVARQAIRQAVEAQMRSPGGVSLGIAGGASGGDILFHEVCAELGIPTHLLLALPHDSFVAASVAPAQGNWVERFARLAASHPPRVLASSKDLPNWLGEKKGYGIWQRNNLWLLHSALAEGDDRVTLIALWNGEEGDGPGGTDDLAERAKKRDARVVILDTRELFGMK